MGRTQPSGLFCMEIPQPVKEQILALALIATPDPVIEKIAESAARVPIVDFANLSSSRDLLDLDLQLRMYNLKSWRNPNYVAGCGGVAAVVLQYFLRAMNKPNNIASVIALFINAYLPLKPEDWAEFLRKGDYTLEHISQTNAQFLASVQFDFNIPKDADYYEKKLLRNYRSALRDKKIEPVYRMIQAVSISSQGFARMPVITNLIRFQCRLNIAPVVAQSAVIQKPAHIVYFLDELGRSELSSWLKLALPDNDWLLFEAIRQLDKKINKEVPEQGEIDSVCAGLCALWNVDRSFFIQAISYLNRSVVTNKALGGLLADIPEVELETVLPFILKFEEHGSSRAIKKQLLDVFISAADREHKTVFFRVIGELWTTFAAAKWSDQNFYRNDLLLSDYDDFVIGYLNEQFSDADIYDQVVKSSGKLSRIDNEWFSSGTRQLTKFHFYLTDLYRLSMVVALRNLVNEVTQDSATLLLRLMQTKPALFKNSAANVRSFISYLG